jgi:biopolymer transport protein ExbD
MRIVSTHTRKRARIEIIPLIDIMFFLLATFIMVSLSMIKNESVPVSLPSAHFSKPSSDHAPIGVTVTKDGKLFWNKEETTLEALPAKLKALADSDAEAKVFIHGDKKADFGLVISVLDDIRNAGIKHTAIRTTKGKQ